MVNTKHDAQDLTPLSRVELLYDELLLHYGDAKDKDIRAAAKLLLVALDRFSRSQANDWQTLVDQYIAMAKHDPDKFAAVISYNRNRQSAR